MRVIAIDGPAGSGKSTIARAVATALGLDYLDTGAMYRSVAFAVLRNGIDPANVEKVGDIARRVVIHVGEHVLVDGEDATEAIRGPAVTLAVTAVAANPSVRRELVTRQRAWVSEHEGGVVEGRDIGSVVFPAAELKVFLTASEEERAKRRRNEAGDEVAADIARRDQADSTRPVSPLLAADDAVIIDTTGRAIDDVVAAVLGHLRNREASA